MKHFVIYRKLILIIGTATAVVCTKMAVKGSVDIALKKLKKLFEKF